MTVTTAPAQPSVPPYQHNEHRQFSTTTPDEASKFQTPKSTPDSQNRPNYILTLRTDTAHQTSMDRLRNIYFPPKLNKLNAHVTLFHALPGQKLDSEILPAIEDIVSTTAPYRIRATGPFRLRAGVGISVADDIEHANKGKHGRNMTRIIHAELRKKWGDWLSDQDASPPRIHYTVMNKVDEDEVVKKALAELEESFKQGVDVSGGHFNDGKGDPNGDSKARESENKHEKLCPEGQVYGLTLWRYDRSGRWLDPVQFDFQG